MATTAHDLWNKETRNKYICLLLYIQHTCLTSSGGRTRLSSHMYLEEKDVFREKVALIWSYLSGRSPWSSVLVSSNSRGDTCDTCQLLHCTEIHLNTFNKDLCSFLKVIFYRCEQHVKGIIVNIIQSDNCTNTASNDFYKPTSASHSHFCQTSRRSHPWCNDTIPQHRQCCQAEDLHSHCDWSCESQEDTGSTAKLPVIETGSQERTGQGEQSAKICQAEIKEHDGAWLGTTAGVPQQHQPEQKMTNPDQKRDKADHWQHHTEGDGGVGGNHIKEVYDSRHGSDKSDSKKMLLWNKDRWKIVRHRK